MKPVYVRVAKTDKAAESVLRATCSRISLNWDVKRREYYLQGMLPAGMTEADFEYACKVKAL